MVRRGGRSQDEVHVDDLERLAEYALVVLVLAISVLVFCLLDIYGVIRRETNACGRRIASVVSFLSSRGGR